ncbi:unnamed protein product [Urochloa humidicola]
MKKNPCLSSLMVIATIILAITVSCSMVVDSSEVQAHATATLDGFRQSLGPPSPQGSPSFHHGDAREDSRSERAVTANGRP